MAASDPDTRPDHPPSGGAPQARAPGLRERLEEEIGRAERHGTGLSCLLVAFENLDEVAREHGGELREQMIEYVAQALRRELRRFDRVGRDARDADHLLVILPGADSPRGEMVARRALERMRTIKVEAGGTRLPLQVSVGLAAWREDVGAEELLAQAHAAVQRLGGEQPPQSSGAAAAGASAGAIGAQVRAQTSASPQAPPPGGHASGE
ncbi:MAG TPA: diguanylate cyclase [Solirubrobacteraceae bacterium]|nr:diguanylate cyclase [Solirubrobacteraceae bacterium]